MGDILTGCLSILKSLVLNCPWISFLTLQGSGVCRGQGWQGSLVHPGCRQPLGSQCSGMPLVPSHMALPSAFSPPPSLVLGPEFISGLEMGAGKSKRSVWGAGPCLLVSILAGAAQGAAQGLSCHSQQGSFLFGNTWEFPVNPTGSGPPVHGPHRAETQHWLCKSDTFIFFFKSPLPNCSILWRGWAVATALWDSPAELYNPSPIPSSLLALSLPWPALGTCLVTPLSL